MALTDYNLRNKKGLVEFLTGADDPADIANFITLNEKEMGAFFDQAAGESVPIDYLIIGLNGDDDERIDQCRYFITEYIRINGDNLPFPPRPDIQPTIEQPITIRELLTRVQDMALAFSPKIPSPILTVPVTVITLGALLSQSLHEDIDNERLISTPEPAGTSQSFEQATAPPSAVIIETAPTPIEAAEEFTEVIEEALAPTPTLSTSTEITEESVAAHGVEGLHLNSDGVIYYHDWVVPTEVYEADVLTSEITGLPLSYMLSVQSLESSFDPDAFNGIKACGLSQFVPSTLAEKAYRYSSLIGYEGIADNLILRTSTEIERTPEQIANGDEVLYNLTYDYASLNAQHTMVRACWDPDYNTRLAAIMQIQDIGRLQRHLAEYAPVIDGEQMDYFPVTELHGYVAHFAGGSAGRGLLEDLLSNDGNALATDYFSTRAIANETNQRLLFNTKTITEIIDGEETERIVPDLENPRTVTEFFAFLEEDKGLSSLPLPDLTDWSTIETTITATIETMNIQPVAVVLTHDHVYGPRPESRPSHINSESYRLANQ